jgi:hypothetical protein
VLYEAIFGACGATDEATFKLRFPEWARNAFRAATGKPIGDSLSGAQMTGYDEGRRAGWAAANRAFCEALKAAYAKLKVQ